MASSSSSSSNSFREEIFQMFRKLHSFLNTIECRIMEREDTLRRTAQEEALNQLAIVYAQIFSSSSEINPFSTLFRNKLKGIENNSSTLARDMASSQNLYPIRDLWNLCDFKSFQNEQTPLDGRALFSDSTGLNNYNESEKPEDMSQSSNSDSAVPRPIASYLNPPKQDINKQAPLDAANGGSMIKSPISLVVPLDPRHYIEAQDHRNRFSSSTFNNCIYHSTLANGATKKNSHDGSQSIDPSSTRSSSDAEAEVSKSCYQPSTGTCQSNIQEIKSEDSKAPALGTQVPSTNSSKRAAANVIGNDDTDNNKSKATKVKENRCPLCSQRFTQLNSLKRHIRSHTGERPFPCEYCDKRFVDRERLKVHIRIHSGEKPFTCSLCNRAFSQKSTVKRHMAVHTGLKPYQCSVSGCEKKFGTKDNLKVHEKKTHNMVSRDSRLSTFSPVLNSSTSDATQQLYAPNEILQIDTPNDLSPLHHCSSHSNTVSGCG